MSDDTEKTDKKQGNLGWLIAVILGALAAYFGLTGEEATEEAPAKAGTVELQPPTEPEVTEPEIVVDTTTEEEE